jgi:zinc/manganese transport system permease protein
MCVLAVAIGALSGVAGLWMSFVAELPSGPSIVLAAGVVYLVSVLAGGRDGIVWRRLRRSVHRTA